MNVIEVKDLTKEFTVKNPVVKKNGKLSKFRKKRSKKFGVDHISFTIKQGEAVAFIGPNGAGKSTTIKMLTGILFPTSGEISVLGLNPSRDRIKLSHMIGTVFGQKEQLWIHLSAYENFKFFGSIYDIPKIELNKRVDELSKLFEIKEYIHQPVKSLSLGQRMKCEMVASLLHNPQMLFFDEPTIGLDPLAKETLRNLIKKINRELGTTIFFTSHDVGDIEEVCKRVIIINNGKMVLDDSVQNLKFHYLNRKIIDLNLKKDVRIPKKNGITVLNAKDTFYKLEIDLNQVSLNHVLSLFEAENIQDISISSTPMEDIIKEIYRGTANE